MVIDMNARRPASTRRRARLRPPQGDAGCARIAPFPAPAGAGAGDTGAGRSGSAAGAASPAPAPRASFESTPPAHVPPARTPRDVPPAQLARAMAAVPLVEKLRRLVEGLDGGVRTTDDGSIRVTDALRLVEHVDTGDALVVRGRPVRSSLQLPQLTFLIRLGLAAGVLHERRTVLRRAAGAAELVASPERLWAALLSTVHALGGDELVLFLRRIAGASGRVPVSRLVLDRIVRLASDEGPATPDRRTMVPGAESDVERIVWLLEELGLVRRVGGSLLPVRDVVAAGGRRVRGGEVVLTDLGWHHLRQQPLQAS